MKRFYTMVTVHHGLDGYLIHLDGKPVRTPMKQVLCTPHITLAEAIRAEWAGQKDTIDVPAMRLTQILSTRLDRVSSERAAMTARLLPYLDTDLLCYRTDSPPDLAARQAALWDPWLDWFAAQFSTPLATTFDLEALRQPAHLHHLIKTYIESLNDDVFTVLQIITPAAGSLVLGLAFIARAITPDQVMAAIRAEEGYKAILYNEELHGPDPAQEAKDRALRADIEAAACYLDLIGQPDEG